MRTFANDPKKQGGAAVRAANGPSRGASLQRSIGNRAVQRLMVGSSGDAREHAADRAAARVAGAGAPHRGHGSRREWPAPPSVHEALRGPGRPLDPATRAFMESSLGGDFSDVRVHTGPAAARSSRAVSARAYTVGRDVVFGAGEYAPDTASGRHVLAHELAHVRQNRAGGATLSRFTTDDCEDIDPAWIKDADFRATRMAGHAETALKQYGKDYPEGKGSTLVEELLAANFDFSGSGPLLDAVIKGFHIIHAAFLKDDYQYECDDDCSDYLAKVYPFWTDIHLCMNKLKSKTTDRVAGVMLHEMSHYAADTDDIEYFYPGYRTTTSLNPYDAVSNADSYEGFAEELYKFR